MKPANMWLPDIEELIKQRSIKQVDSVLIKEPSTEKFHPYGLYSEEIFGNIASPQRLVTMGYIDLRTKVFHPHVYNTYCSINRLYEQIMSGKTEAVWDEKEKNFFKLKDTKDLKPYHEVGTGYAFFMKHHTKIKLDFSASITRNNDIKLIDKYKHCLITSKWLVEPAGLRDYRLDEDRPQTEDINKIYTGLIIISNTLPSKPSEDAIWDPIRLSIQKRLCEINDYIFNILDGKGGFVQKKFMARSIAMASRNVLTGAPLCSASSKGYRQRSDETYLPLFQAAKAFLPAVVYYMNTVFLNHVINQSSNELFGIDAKNDLVKITLGEEEKKKFTTREGIEDKIEVFRTPEIRANYFSVLATDKKRYNLFLVYEEDENNLFFLRNRHEFAVYYEEIKGVKPDFSKLRPLTNAEVLYICTEFAIQGRHVENTRYPVLGTRNTYFSKTKVMTTEPARVVNIIDVISGASTAGKPFFNYPKLQEHYVEGVRIHSIWLKNIGGDHDGDQGNQIGIWSDEATAELQAYLNSYNYFLTPSGALKVTIDALNPVIDITFKNMCTRTYEPQPN